MTTDGTWLRAGHAGTSGLGLVTFLHTLQNRLLRYDSPAKRQQEAVFSSARQLARAQFHLADEELTRRLWQDVADQGLDVDRILNLLYGCWFQDDPAALQDADAEYLQQLSDSRAIDPTSRVGIFEHC